ncbi:MAG: SDR family NAD(P)-dependent oxidoreductase [Proteobacteria bacterium]|nr:SDR family NAD(P)-dependent oxidoreductase [Pseudomonadota bacterium]
MTGFAGKRVVVTGAGGVYGQALARAFAAAGARIFLSDRNAAALTDLAADLALPDDRLILDETDLTDPEAIAVLARRIADAWGAPDILVNNAGIYPFQDILEVSAEDWDRVMAVNLRAPFLLSQTLAKAMIAHGVRGSIVNIGSPSARILRTNGLPYCVSKRGLDWLAKGLALALGPYGIRVNTVEPGLALGSAQIAMPPAHIKGMAKGNPLGRIGRAEDLPGVVMFLCSDAADYITGASLPADGGGSIPRRAPT